MLESARNAPRGEHDSIAYVEMLIEQIDSVIANLEARAPGFKPKDPLNIPSPPARGMKSEVPPGG